jgi:uncharacterized membrane protein
LRGENLTYTVTVKNTGGEADTYNLTKSDNAGWLPTLSSTSLTVPGRENRTVTLRVKVPDNAPEDTRDNITVTATSTENAALKDNDSCIARAILENRLGVEVSISPSSQDNIPGGMLRYTVTITNTGNVTDDYVLAVDDDAGWTLTLVAAVTDVVDGEAREVTLTVGIPATAESGTSDNITVTATSSENTAIENSDACVARCLLGGGSVQVTIDSASKSGAPGTTLDFLVTVTNTGTSTDTFTLTATDTENWGPTLQVTTTPPLDPEESRQNIRLSITIPSAAVDGASTTITVTATGTGYENSATCTATAEAGGFPVIYIGAAVVVVVAIVALLILKPF